MNILAQLKKDHHEIAGLFRLLENTANQDSAHRRDLFEKLNLLLSKHTRAEEEVFYSAIAADPKEKDHLLEAKEEHRLADKLLGELAHLNCGHETWLPKVIVLRENVDHHVKEEETRLFKYAEKNFDKKQLDQMGKEFVEKCRAFSEHFEKAS